jgi:histidine kinase
VICEVCDTGKGVSDAIADKIFEPFFTTKEVGKGTGLGLSISYGIIKECGGSIQVVPNKTEGACFVLKFPIPKTTHGNGQENITRR